MACCLENKELFMYVIWGVYAGLFFQNHFLRQMIHHRVVSSSSCDRGWVMEYPDQGAEALCGKMAKSLYKRQGHAFFFHTQGGTYDVKESFGNRGLACIPSMNAFD